MEAPLLKLTVQKGPCEGEIIEGKPGAKNIRIGRVIKGNTFSIKDPGISSKHLLIEFKDNKWLVSDLDSSNGTFLNGKQIKANVGVGLKDGDLIKIGELSSIGVSIVSIGSVSREKEEEVSEVEVKPKQRRGRVRKDEKVGAVEPPVVDLENGVGRGRRNLRRGAKAKEEQQEVLPAAEENVGSLVEKRGRRVGRGVKNSKNVQFVGVPEVEGDEVAESSQDELSHGEQEEVLPPVKENVAEKRGRQVGRKGTKNSKNVAVNVSEMDAVDGDERMKSSQGEPSQSGQIFVSEAPEVQQEVNSKKESPEVQEQEEVLLPEKENVDIVEKRGRQVARRGTKNSKKVTPEVQEQEEVLPSEKENVNVVEKRGRQVARRGAKNSKKEILDVQEPDEVLPSEKENADVVEKRGRQVARRGAKNSKKEIPDVQEPDEVLPPEKENADVVEKRGRQVARNGTENSTNVCCENAAVGVSEMDIVDKDKIMKSSQGEASQSGQIFVPEAPEVQEELNLKNQTCDELNDTTGIDEASKKDEKIASMKMTLDQLQQMTLGEWFDFMEVYLVKKIYEETDEIIAGMQSRAEQFEKFMSEQESLKNKSPLF